jgi:hypothetical protein
MKPHHLFILLALAACNKASSEKAPAAKPVEVPADDEPTSWENEPSGQDPDDPPPIQQAFEAWVSAQERGELDSYLAAYSEDFVGVRTSNGERITLDLAAWTKERKKMFAGGMQIAIENPRFDGDTVTFTQRYRRGDYEDHGLKVLTFDSMDRIVREEMIWSVEGWKDSSFDPIDAMSMTPPFTVRLSSTTTNTCGTDDCECVSDKLELELEDAAGKRTTFDAGATHGGWDGKPRRAGVKTYEKPAGGKKLYDLGKGGYCAGLELGIHVERIDRAIVIVEDIDDEESPVSGDRRAAFVVSPGAEVIAK